MATVSSGQEITAAQYNDLQSRVNNILGSGSYSSSDVNANSGYGQSLASSQVSAGTTILASHMDTLLTDINKCRNHQSGADSNSANIAVGDVIGADASGTNAQKGYNDYNASIVDIELNRFEIWPTQATSGTFNANSVRTTPWNGTITHQVRLTFDNFAHRRYFFNAGGEIRFAATLTNTVDSKGSDWATMLTNMGTISFNYYTTTQGGSGGTAASIGNYGLTTNPQTIYTRYGNLAVYAENKYQITSQHNSDLPSTGNILTFTITFADLDQGDRPPNPPPPPYGPIVDENVQGTLTSYIQFYQPSGSNVSISLPSITTTTSL